MWISREELALALNMSSTTIQNIENGKNATLDNLIKIANHFGLLENIYKSIETIDDTNSPISLYQVWSVKTILKLEYLVWK